MDTRALTPTFSDQAFRIATPRLLELLESNKPPSIITISVWDQDGSCGGVLERARTWGDVVASPRRVSLRYDQKRHVLWVFSGSLAVMKRKARQTLYAANHSVPVNGPVHTVAELIEAVSVLARMPLPPRRVRQ